MADAKTRSRASFNAFFRHELSPALASLEKVRKLRFRVMVGVVAAGAAALILFLVFGGRYAFYFFHVGLGIVLLALLLIRVVLSSAMEATLIGNKKRVDFFSQEVIARTGQYALPGLRYDRLGQIGASDFIDSRLFGYHFNTLGGRDCFHGGGRGYSLTFSWIKAEFVPKNTTNQRNKQSHQHLFTGWFFLVRFGKRFEGETMVVPDTAEAAFSWLGRAVQKAVTPGEDRLVQLEDAAFEKLFKVVSTGELDARYVLTPVFMRTAARVGEKVGGKMYFSFRKNTMYVAVPTVNEYFSNMPVKSFLDPAFTRQLYHAALGVDELAQAVVAHQKVWEK